MKLENVNGIGEQIDPVNILKLAVESFGKSLIVSSSFQTQSVPLLHMISKTCPKMPVLFIDTGYHFKETLSFRDKVVSEFNLNLVNVFPRNHKNKNYRTVRAPLYEIDPDFCCQVNKVEPVVRYLKENDIKVWIAGVRRDQTESRQRVSVIENGPHNVKKIHPLAVWSKEDVMSYIRDNDLPVHPLFGKGFTSIGCDPCTHPIKPSKEEDERRGRWKNFEKSECGIHRVMPNSKINEDLLKEKD